MSVEQTSVVDFTNFDPKSGKVFLNISDHLPWDEKGLHLKLLQDKLNAYLAFIESGELQTKLPETVGKPICIRVIGKYPPNEQAKLFLGMATTAIQGAGFDLQFHLFGSKDDT